MCTSGCRRSAPALVWWEGRPRSHGLTPPRRVQPKEEEEDMLDLALGLTKTSRLGCQVIVDLSMDGMVVSLPSEVANMQGPKT
jgi:hypothetical protein